MKPFFLSLLRCIRSTILWIGLLWSASLCAQTQRFSLHFAPLALIDDVSFPTIQAGVGYRVSNRVMLYSEAGIKYRRSMYESTDTPFVASRGFKWKGEVRLYDLDRIFQRLKLGLPAIPKECYVGFNVFYTRDAHNTQMEYYAQGDSVNLRQDNFGVHKSVLGFNFLAGAQVYLVKHWLMLDVYAGAGLRRRFISTVNKEYDAEKDDFINRSIDLNVQDIRIALEAKGGNSTTINLTAGIRLCLSF